MNKKNIVYGGHVVKLLITTYPKMILELHTLRPEEWQALIKEHKNNIKIQKKSLLQLDNLAQDRNHQGIVAFVEAYPYYSWAQLVNDISNREKDLILILDKVQDPQNFGTIIRSALLLGVKNIIIANRHQAPITAAVVRASVGAVYLMKITMVTNLNQTINKLKGLGYWIYSSNLNQQALDSRTVEYASKSVLIVGNEHHGVGKLLTENSDVNLFIPTATTKVDSLNVAIATAILIFQISSQLGLF